MNLPHSSWLEWTSTPKAAIILWPAHVGILRVVRSAFSWLAEWGQGLFRLVLSCMQLSSKHLGSLFGSVFLMWGCVHVCKLVWLHFACWKPDWNLKSSLCICWRWPLWWNILTAHLEWIFHTSLRCVLFLRGYNVIITLHLWNVPSPSETSRSEIGESCLKAEETVRASAYLKALAGLNTTPNTWQGVEWRIPWAFASVCPTICHGVHQVDEAGPGLSAGAQWVTRAISSVWVATGDGRGLHTCSAVITTATQTRQWGKREWKQICH